MKPMKVTAGEFAPDVEEMLEKATNMEEMLMKVAELQDDSQMRNITGVEEAPMTHYWTNQQQPEEKIESVSKKNVGPQNVTMLDANPHQTGSTLAAHENTAGGIRKAQKPDFLDMDGDGDRKEPMRSALKDKKKGKKVKKANLMDMLKPKPGGPDGPDMDDGPGGPPKMDMDDEDDADGLAEKIKSLVDELADKSGDSKPKLPMPKPPMGGGGPPGPLGH